MEEIYSVKGGGSIWVGDDNDYLKIKDNPEWKSCRMAKYGPGCHKDTLGYTSAAAPQGKNYLSVETRNRMAVNVLDLDDPNMVPFECFKIALDYAKKQLDNGFKVLLACNSGHSRGPSTGLAFLRSIGELPYHFVKSERIYRTLYPRYSPGMGVRQVIKEHWKELDRMEL